MADVAPKSILASKTLWWTILTGVANTLSLIGSLPIPQPAGIIIQSIGTILLRLVTTQPVTVP